ncbi:hypothetical protein JL720_10759 [Aureococcus anophagefferens]|nr:hypothetical protein JL720_10759 [Aureococcus anophagefferens]
MADADYPSKVLQRALSTADYLASRNLDGLAALKRHCAQTSGKEGDHPDLPVAPLPDGWPRAIPLKGACMTGSLATLAYLFERGADPTSSTSFRDTACHVAVAWGRVDAVAYLLARGARHDATIDTEVRQRRVALGSSRVRMTMRGLPEPTDAARQARGPQKRSPSAPPELRRMPTPLSPTCWGDDDEPAARTDGLGGMDERVIDDAAVTARYRNARLIDDAAVRSRA